MIEYLNTLIVLVGPTASGKTSLALKIAEEFNAEIISADSRQFFREIPVGTAAPDSESLKKVKHHLVGQLSIIDEYNVSKFEQDVLSILKKEFLSHRVMILTGGSGLYINAVCNGIDELPDADKEIRSSLEEIFQQSGIKPLLDMLKKYDPEYYKVVDQNNPKRIIRGIEVCMQTGIAFSELRKKTKTVRPFNIVKIGLELPREELYRRINSRTDEMINSSWIEEASRVIAYKHLNSLNTVGFKELFSYLENKISLEEAILQIKTNTRHFAKRQLTWFKKDPEIKWFSPLEVNKILLFLNNRIKQNGLTVG